MTFVFKDKFSERDGITIREFQIPVKFPIPKPFVDDRGPEVLQSFLWDTQKKLEAVSLCIEILTLVSMRLAWEGENQRSKKVGNKLKKLLRNVEDFTEYGLRESLRLGGNRRTR